MYSQVLPLIKSVLRPKPKGPVPPLETTLSAYRVSEAKLNTFRQLTQYPNNGYLPLNWPFIAGWQGHLKNLTHPSFPLRLPGIVHIGNEIFQKRPIGAGEELRITCKTEADGPHPRGIAFSLLTQVSSRQEIVSSSRAFLLYKSGGATPLIKPPLEISLDGLGSENHRWSIKGNISRKFALLSGDINPIHLSKFTAMAFGFKGILIHGNWILSRILGEHEDILKNENIRFTCQFKRPIILPAQVIYRFWSDAGIIHFRVLNTQSSIIFAYGTLTSTAPIT
jgi:hypothetical protein